MKAMLLVMVSLVVVLVSCGNMPTTSSVSKGSLRKDMQWCAENVKYKADVEAHGAYDYWQSSKETLDLRTGDCEDYCILFMEMAKEKGYDSRLVVAEAPNGILHAMVSCDGKVWDIEANRAYENMEDCTRYKLTKRSYSYDDVQVIVNTIKRPIL